MKNIKNILVGVDFSESSKAALIEALRIAAHTDAHVTVLHVIDSDLAEYITEETKLPEADLIDQAFDRLTQYLVTHLGCSQTVNAEVLIGHPFVEIFRATKNHLADLLVLGSGGTDVDGEHAGLLASRCVRKVPTKVMLVRDRVDGPFQRVVACVDFSENSKEAIELAAQIAVQDNAELHMLHVCRPVVPGIHGDTGAFVGGKLFDIALPPYPELDYAKRQKERLEREASEMFGEKYPELKVIGHVYTETKPSRGIVRFLGKENADLVVLGTRGRTGVRSLLMGTTAEKIVNHSPCSVLAIKPEGFHYEI
jgi:universal stress protein E